MTAEQSIRNIEREADEFNRGKQNVDNMFSLLGEAVAPKPVMDPPTLDAVEALVKARMLKTSWASDARQYRLVLADIEGLRS